MSTGSGAKRWCFTLNNPDLDPTHDHNDRFWDNTPGSDSLEPFGVHMDYLVCQLEQAPETGTRHLQGFLILKARHNLLWVKRHLSERAHWEVARGTNPQCKAYCTKDATRVEGDDAFSLELGAFPQRQEVKKRDERLQEAAEELDVIKDGYKRPADIPSMTLLQCGFMPAYTALTADVLGPYRPDLQIFTLIGPPGTGKSYAIHHFWPAAGRCIMGNSGIWFQNPTADCIVFEEFHGQIPIAKMLQFLDVYPMALEVKGGMRPAMYRTVVITSNTSPQYWYKPDPEDPRRQDTIHALWDRLGFSDGSYVPVRTCGHYFQAADYDPSFGVSHGQYIADCRSAFWDGIANVLNLDPVEDDDDLDRHLTPPLDP